jgi:hypothetical protein
MKAARTKMRHATQERQREGERGGEGESGQGGEREREVEGEGEKRRGGHALGAGERTRCTRVAEELRLYCRCLSH